MRRLLRPAGCVIVLALLARGAAGCSHTYDGSADFNEQHPEYGNQPSYMHPNDPPDPDAPPPRSW